MTTDPTAPVPPPASKPNGLPGAAVLKAAIKAAADQARQDLEQRRRVRETAKKEEEETKKLSASDADNDTAKQPSKPAPRMRMHWGQVTAFVAVILMWTFGAYYGFIAVPQLDALGGILALIALVAIVVGPFIIVRSDKMWVRLVGVLLAIVGGVILATSWHAFLGVFVSFRALSTLGLAIAIIVTGLVAWWICRVPLQAEADSHRKTVTDAPKPAPPTPAPVPPPASPATPVAVTPASPATPTVVAPKPAPPASRRKSTSHAPRGKSSPPAPTESTS